MGWPSSPAVGQDYELEGITWQWNGYAWDKITNDGQVVVAFNQVAWIHQTIEEFPYTENVWSEVNYI